MSRCEKCKYCSIKIIAGTEVFICGVDESDSVVAYTSDALYYQCQYKDVLNEKPDGEAF